MRNNMSKKVYHMGLDIGSTTIKIVITDEYDNMLYHHIHSLVYTIIKKSKLCIFATKLNSYIGFWNFSFNTFSRCDNFLYKINFKPL